MAQPRCIWEVAITAANDRLEFDEGGGALAAVIPQGNYYLRGGGAAATDLLQTLETLLTLAGANTYAVTVSDTGRVTIARSAGALNFTLHWATDGTGESAAIGWILGFNTAADDGPGTTFTSDYQHRYGWYPGKELLDGRRIIQRATAGATRALGGQQYAQVWETGWRTTARIDFVPRTKVRQRDIDGTWLLSAAEAHEAFGGSTITFYEHARAGGRFEFHANVASHAAFATVVIDPSKADWFEDQEEATPLLLEAGERYRALLPMLLYVA